jgi:hypothetical protein
LVRSRSGVACSPAPATPEPTSFGLETPGDLAPARRCNERGHAGTSQRASGHVHVAVNVHVYVDVYVYVYGDGDGDGDGDVYVYGDGDGDGDVRDTKREAETLMVREAAASGDSPASCLPVDSFSSLFGALRRLGG